MAKSNECKNCGGKVSVWATKCPHCGQTSPTQSWKDTVGGLLLLAIIGGGLWFWLGDTPSSSPKAEEIVEVGSNPIADGPATSGNVREFKASEHMALVVQALRDHYAIEPLSSDDTLIQDIGRTCWNERSCEVFAKSVQIQAVNNSVAALTSSQVTAQFYMQVCSAIFIALTGEGKPLAEQSVASYFDYASINGRARWKALGIGVTISPDSRGLLGCEFDAS